MVSTLKNKCSVWKRIKFPTFWYNCYYFTWSDTYFIQLETLLINHPLHFLFYLLILYLIKRKGVLYQVKSKQRFIQITQSLALRHITLVRDCFLQLTPASIIGYQPFSCLNSSPYNPSYYQQSLNIRYQIKLITHGHKPSVTDARKPNNCAKMIGYNCHVSGWCGPEVWESQAEVPTYVWCEDTKTSLLFGCRVWGGHEQMGWIRLSCMWAQGL